MSVTCINVVLPHIVSQETLVLRLHKPKTDKKVKWEEGTVDNEFLGKKKSKCEHSLHLCLLHTCTPSTVSPPGCCIYAKPHKFGESDTESDSDDGDGDDCCHEHRVARRRMPKPQPLSEGGPPDTS